MLYQRLVIQKESPIFNGAFPGEICRCNSNKNAKLRPKIRVLRIRVLSDFSWSVSIAVLLIQSSYTKVANGTLNYTKERTFSYDFNFPNILDYIWWKLQNQFFSCKALLEVEI